MRTIVFDPKGMDYYKTMEDVQEYLVRAAITQTWGDMHKAGRLLNINRTTLYEMTKRFKIDLNKMFYGRKTQRRLKPNLPNPLTQRTE